MTARLLFGAVEQASGSWSGSNWTSGSTRQIVLSFDALAHATGLYPYTVEVTRWYSGGPQAQSVSGELVIVNRSASPFGAGWWLAGYEQLIDVGDGRKLWIGGDGSSRVFSTPNAGVRTTTNLDWPEVLDSVGTHFRRWLPHRGMVMFDVAGRHANTRNALAFANDTIHPTRFVHDASGRLWKLQLPVASGTMEYVFSYNAGGKLQSVTAPQTNSPRITELTVTGGRLEAIRGPDLRWVSFLYTDGIANRITGRTNRLNVTTSFSYGPANALAGSSLALISPEAIAYSLQPQESRGINGSAAISPALAYTRVDGPRSDVADSTLFWLDRFGAPTRIRDALRYETVIARTDSRWPILATRVQYPNGHVLGATYDGRGNIDSSTDSSTWRDESGGRRYATTRYTWDQQCDHVTKVIAPEGDSARFGYHGSTCNLDWSEDGRGPTTQVDFRYHETGIHAGLLRAVQAPNGTRDSLAYDALLGNLTTSWSPSGIQARLERDAIGRLTVNRMQLDSGATIWQDDSLSYDAADRVIREVKYAPAFPAPAQRLVVRNFYNYEGRLDSLQRSSIPDTAHIGVITTRWRYDRAGRAVAEISPDGRVDSTRYDPAGNATIHRTRRLHVMQHTYDALNRLTRRISPEVIYADTTHYYAGSSYWRFPRYPSCQSTKLCIPVDTAVFAYDEVGNQIKANNRDAQIGRSYNANGTLASDTLRIRTLAELSAGGNFSSHVYAVRHGYDLNGRRSWTKFPANLAAQSSSGAWYDSLGYQYDGPTGRLSQIRDMLGNQYAFTYDVLGRLERTDYPFGHFKRNAYDSEGRIREIRQDRTSTNSADWNEIGITFDIRGKVQSVLPLSGFPNNRIEHRYSALGALTTDEAIYASIPKTSSNLFVGDALANIVRESRSYSEINFNYYLSAASTDTMLYQAGTGRLVNKGSSGSSQYDLYHVPGECEWSYQSERHDFRYDLAGNAHWSTSEKRDTVVAKNPDGFCNQKNGYVAKAARASYYDAGGNLRVQDDRGTTAGSVTLPIAYQEYRYDALGRRILRRTRDCISAPDCDAQSMRIVWDGVQILAEIRFTEAQPESDDVGQPSTVSGRKLYVHAGDVDQPIAVVRIGYQSCQPFAFVPDWDWKGRGYGHATYGPTLCSFELAWPIRDSHSRTRFWADPGGNPPGPVGPAFGSLVDDQRDAIGQLYRRNRYYDPSIGRFTQEDPIGLAGGLNLYGFANGDPVNFSDPFGLQAMADGECPPAYVAVGDTCYNEIAIAAMVVTGGLSRVGWAARSVAAGIGNLARAIKISRAGDDIFAAAQAGGKHAGFLRNYAGRSAGEIGRAQRSLQRHARRHEGYLKDPRSKVSNWDELSPERQRAILEAWKTEIMTAREQIEILERIQ